MSLIELLNEKCVNLESIPQFLEEFNNNDNTEDENLDTAPKRSAEELQTELTQLEQKLSQLKLTQQTSKLLKSPNENLNEIMKIYSKLEPDSELRKTIDDQFLLKATSQAETELKNKLNEFKYPQEVLPRLTLNKGLKTALTDLLTLQTESVFKLLAKPIGDRIVYNFSKSRDTAQKEKPEWLFIYLFKSLEQHSHWLLNELQQLVENTTTLFIKALLPFLHSASRTYVFNEHFMLELINCANTLETEYFISPNLKKTFLETLAGPKSQFLLFLQQQEQIYLKVLQNNILKERSKTDFDADVVSAKPTFAALHVKQLILDADKLLVVDPELVLTKCHFPIIQLFYSNLSAQEPSLVNFGAVSFFASFLKNWSLQFLVSNATNFVTDFTDLKQKVINEIVKNELKNAKSNLKRFILTSWHDPDRALIDVFIKTGSIFARDVEKLTSLSRADYAAVMVKYAEGIASLLNVQIVQANVFTHQGASVLEECIERVWKELRLPKVLEYKKLSERVRVLVSGEPSGEFLGKEELRGLVKRRA